MPKNITSTVLPLTREDELIQVKGAPGLHRVIASKGEHLKCRIKDTFNQSTGRDFLGEEGTKGQSTTTLQLAKPSSMTRALRRLPGAKRVCAPVPMGAFTFEVADRSEGLRMAAVWEINDTFFPLRSTVSTASLPYSNVSVALVRTYDLTTDHLQFAVQIRQETPIKTAGIKGLFLELKSLTNCDHDDTREQYLQLKNLKDATVTLPVGRHRLGSMRPVLFNDKGSQHFELLADLRLTPLQPWASSPEPEAGTGLPHADLTNSEI